MSSIPIAKHAKDVRSTAERPSEALRKRFELDAYHQANKRSKALRFTGMLFDTPAGLLLIKWERYGWSPYWLPEPVKLKVRTGSSNPNRAA